MSLYQFQLTRERKGILSDLLKFPTKLDDWHLNDLLSLMATILRLSKSVVRLVDTTILETLYQYSHEPTDKDYLRHKTVLWKKLRCSQTTLLPFCHSDHWSLLVFVSKTKEWFHFDSLSPYHDESARDLLDILSHNVMKVKMTSIQNLPRQKSSWECGFYALFYALVVMRLPLEPDTWSEHASMASDFTLDDITSALLKLVEKT